MNAQLKAEYAALRAAGIADWLARLSANAPWPITDADLSWPAGTLALVAEEAILTGIAPEDSEAVCRIAERVQDELVSEQASRERDNARAWADSMTDSESAQDDPRRGLPVTSRRYDRVMGIKPY